MFRMFLCSFTFFFLDFLSLVNQHLFAGQNSQQIFIEQDLAQINSGATQPDSQTDMQCQKQPQHTHNCTSLRCTPPTNAHTPRKQHSPNTNHSFALQVCSFPRLTAASCF